MFQKILIANRGEIVARILRTSRRLGLRTVAVYSEADRAAPYLSQADEAHLIGPANPARSYLNAEALCAVIRSAGVDAVHPGYGFLSENGAFAEAVAAAGATWIGPRPAVLRAIESKCHCRELAQRLGIPVIPGTDRPVAGLEEVEATAERIGYPVLLKLDKGGGGKGIEIVHSRDGLRAAFERMGRVGKLAFDSADCYVERAVERPRHIEVQFLIDAAGACVCLGERECSIQRRYQKIIEESPSPVVTAADRQALFGYTRALVQAMGYTGAGTVEYLRGQDGRYYFMELNARLQVEHAVTEAVTGLDLVEQQLRIAAGEPLSLRQDQVALRGHAIECRVYAEDPVTFAPSPGTLRRLVLPEEAAGQLRVDHALIEGGKVPPYYDPLLAKVISWAEDRGGAADRLAGALRAFEVEGVKTTVPANLEILTDPEYLSGQFDTGFIAARAARAARAREVA